MPESLEHGLDCSCCAGIDAETPQPVDNPPGLSAITHRAGSYGDYLESLQARLSSSEYPALLTLSTREQQDFTLALCDALASSLEVLSFYTERYANEHFLRTARERLSVLELARLIGYRLSPGVAASTHLAFKVLGTPTAPAPPTRIPVGTRVQSVPRVGETAQTFETVVEIEAREEWNAIPVERSQRWWPKQGDRELWLEGATTQLSVGDAILIVGNARRQDPTSEHWDIRVLAAVEPDAKAQRTRLRWSQPLGSNFPPMTPASVGVEVHAFRQRTHLFGHNAPDPNLLGKSEAPSISWTGNSYAWVDFTLQPPNIDLATENPRITAGSWLALVSNQPELGSPELPGYTELYRVARVVHRSRVDFGMSSKIVRVTPDTTENLTATRYPLRRTLVLAQSELLAHTNTPLLHPVYGDSVVLGRRVTGLDPGQPLEFSGPRQRVAIARGATGVSLDLDRGVARALTEGDQLFMLGPASRVLGGSTLQVLDAKAFLGLIGNSAVRLSLRVADLDGAPGTLRVNGGQIALAPSRDDDPNVSEIAYVATSSDAVELQRDSTQLQLAAPLRHVFERARLRVNANVAPATHGETVTEIAGSGNGSATNQMFSLAQGPLTYVSANTPTGSASTLEVRVNDALWREAASLFAADSQAHSYETSVDAAQVTTIRFGDGVEGARLPTGASNVRVQYRKGTGLAGNVAAGQLTTLLTRPLGVSEVSNPEPATGGDDPESLDRARENAPLTVLTLDRAVSVSDYQNFARAFAGIDKAHALYIPAGPARGVFVSIAGVGGSDVLKTSKTYLSLHQALSTYGDPQMPIRLENYRSVRFKCRLSVKVQGDFEVEPVLEAVRGALRQAFSFASRRFGQPVSVDEVSAVAQRVRGIEATHVTRLHLENEPDGLNPRLFARLPVASLTSVPEPAELLTLADAPIQLEVMA